MHFHSTLERQHRLDAIQGLDLRLLVHRGNNCPPGGLRYRPTMRRPSRRTRGPGRPRTCPADAGSAPSLVTGSPQSYARPTRLRYVRVTRPSPCPTNATSPRQMDSCTSTPEFSTGRRRNLFPHDRVESVKKLVDTVGLVARKPQVHHRARPPARPATAFLLSTLGLPQHDPRSDSHPRRNVRPVHRPQRLCPLFYGQLHMPIQHYDLLGRHEGHDAT